MSTRMRTAPRAASEDTRNQIKAAAQMLFARHGVDAVTVQQIVAALTEQVARPTVTVLASNLGYSGDGAAVGVPGGRPPQQTRSPCGRSASASVFARRFLRRAEAISQLAQTVEL